MDRYRILNKVGEGTFGEVFRALQIETDTIVALKKIRVRRVEEGIPKGILREVKALEHISHTNVVTLLEYFPHGSSIVIVFEYMATDLFQIMKSFLYHGNSILLHDIKTIVKKLLRGLNAVHEQSIMHRDIKPANILFNEKGELKLADFGLARISDTSKPDPNYSHEVATRWYRSPELLFGSRRYSSEVDVWAVGCIFGELLNGSPLFPGENDIDQLYRVFSIMGTPDETTWPNVHKLPDYGKISFPQMEKKDLYIWLGDAPSQAVNLLEKMLALCPTDRISAKEALCHPFLLERDDIYKFEEENVRHLVAEAQKCKVLLRERVKIDTKKKVDICDVIEKELKKAALEGDEEW